MKYYTYAYLREDGTPYYIGKGSRHRIREYHSKYVKVPPKDRRLILKRFIDEDTAYQHEIYMISVYGRKDNNTGILINRTNGGDKPPKNNVAGWNRGLKQPCKPERAAKVSAALKGHKKSPEWRESLSKAMRGKTPHNIKTYEFITPEGICVIVKNLRIFCEENKLTYSSMGKLYRGELKQHKGYRYARTV